jgi:hypothetical protein
LSTDQQPNPEPDVPAGILLARDTMSGDIRDLVLAEIKAARDGQPFHKLRYDEQQALIDRITARARQLVVRAVNIIATDGKRTIEAAVEKVDVKEGIKVHLKVPRTLDSLTQLGMAVGLNCQLWVADSAPYLGERQPQMGVPDQGDMLGDNPPPPPRRRFTREDFTAAEPVIQLVEMLAEPDPRLDRWVELGGRLEFDARAFGAHTFAFGPAEHGLVKVAGNAEIFDTRPSLIAYVAPEASEFDGDKFVLTLIDDSGKSTCTLMVAVHFGAVPQEAEPQPEAPAPVDGAGNGAAEPDMTAIAEHLDAEDAAASPTNGNGDTGEAEEGLLPPPPAGPKRRAGGRRRAAGGLN